MIARYNSISLKLGVPGILMQIAGAILNGYLAQTAMANHAPVDPGAELGVMVLLLGGTGLLMAGLAFYAKAKGHHPVWCLMGFLSLIGLIVLAVLKDKYPNGQPPPLPNQ